MSSTFTCPVVKIKLEPHPNADTLSIVRIGGYQVVVKTEEWKDGDAGIYVPPDSVVPDRPEWAFLEGKFRIRTRRFRGEWSHGVLVRPLPLASDLRVGDDKSRDMGIIPYEPLSATREGMSARDRRRLPWYRRIWMAYRELRERPQGSYPYYDIENLRRCPELFQPGEVIIITEKVHGANALYTSKRPWYSRNPKIYMRSRTLWKHPNKSDWWQEAYRNTPGLELLLRDFPGLSVYGEVYGPNVQSGFGYGVKGVHFVGFDIRKDGKWMDQADALELMRQYDVPTVPTVSIRFFNNNEDLYKLANEEFRFSLLAESNGQRNHISEGIVVQSLESRKILKIVSDVYLEKER